MAGQRRPPGGLRQVTHLRHGELFPKLRLGRNNALYLYCTSRENDPSLAAVAMNVFDTSEVVVDPKGAVRSQPFKHYLARREHASDRPWTDPADPARVFIAQQLKHPQLGRGAFCNCQPFLASQKAAL